MPPNQVISMGFSTAQIIPPNSSLVVIGAHHFGGDPNDPTFKAVSRVAWSDVRLVEASPHIAAHLQAKVAGTNPLPLVQHWNVRVVNQGVCPRAADEQLQFYSFDDTPGLPFWATPHMIPHL